MPSSPLLDALEKAVIKDRYTSMLGFPKGLVFLLWLLASSVGRGRPSTEELTLQADQNYPRIWDSFTKSQRIKKIPH